jgi:hypothetical protein
LNLRLPARRKTPKHRTVIVYINIPRHSSIVKDDFGIIAEKGKKPFGERLDFPPISGSDAAFSCQD